MELPEDVLKIIKEYSRPLTRPDWKKIHRMPEFTYCVSLAKEYNDSRNNIFKKVLDKNKKYKYMYCTLHINPYINFVYNPAFIYNSNCKEIEFL
jgi:hypothetical protein